MGTGSTILLILVTTTTAVDLTPNLGYIVSDRSTCRDSAPVWKVLVLPGAVGLGVTACTGPGPGPGPGPAALPPALGGGHLLAPLGGGGGVAGRAGLARSDDAAELAVGVSHGDLLEGRHKDDDT